MCTVTFVPTSTGFVFTSNRDENPKRSAKQVIEERRNNLRIFYPQDESAKGTWFAFSDRQQFACILNGAFQPHMPKQKYRLSRGKMALSFFDSPTIDSFVRGFDFEGMEPFTFLVYHNKDFRELRWDEVQLHERVLSTQKTHLWSSSTLYNKQWGEERKKAFHSFVKTGPSAFEIVEYHLNNLPYSSAALQALLGLDRPPENFPIKTTSVSSIQGVENHWQFSFQSTIHPFRENKLIKTR